MHFVYIVRCADKRLYVGLTTDLDARLQRLNLGKGAAFTSTRLPVRLVYAEGHHTFQAAAARERQLKRWSARKKEALIAADEFALHLLSRRRKWRKA